MGWYPPGADGISSMVEAHYEQLWEALCAQQEAEYERDARLWKLEEAFFAQFSGEEEE